jgi:hypothetical protein
MTRQIYVEYTNSSPGKSSDIILQKAILQGILTEREGPVLDLLELTSLDQLIVILHFLIF